MSRASQSQSTHCQSSRLLNLEMCVLPLLNGATHIAAALLQRGQIQTVLYGNFSEKQVWAGSPHGGGAREQHETILSLDSAWSIWGWRLERSICDEDCPLKLKFPLSGNPLDSVTSASSGWDRSHRRIL